MTVSATSMQLRARIADEIRARGPMPFHRFMGLALYTPDLGYYTGPRVKIGKKGDFFTSLDLHPVFGRLIGAQIIEMSAALPEGPFTVVEMGAGKGFLAYDILRTIQAADPALFTRLRYVIVDVSPDLIARQRTLLADFTDRLEWAEGLSALTAIDGVMLSNELVDSLPHHQLVQTDEGLKEVFVTLQGDQFRELLVPPSTAEIDAHMARVGVKIAEGYRTEVNLDAHGWMAEVGRVLNRGYVMTVDYGYPADIYYQSDRKRGTFLCYHEHKVSEDPYARVGEQDMTAHVDFSSLAWAGSKAGLTPLAFTDQAHFLVGMGIVRLMEMVLDRDGGDPQKSDEFRAMRKLMDPNGMGKAFKVLLQQKGVENHRLSGFCFPALHLTDLQLNNED